MKRYEVTPPGQFVYWLPLGSMALVFIGVALGVAIGSTEQNRLTELLWVLPAVVAVGPLLLLLMRRRRVTLDGATLEVRATLHTLRVAVADLDLAAARIVDLSLARELRPMLRTFGFGMPGFRAGHYRLRSMQRGFCLLTKYDRVLALPERSGRVILLSLERPQQLLDALRATGS
jgi:hypothetical protein